mgnify:CR=1 FL=1
MLGIKKTSYFEVAGFLYAMNDLTKVGSRLLRL